MFLKRLSELFDDEVEHVAAKMGNEKFEAEENRMKALDALFNSMLHKSITGRMRFTLRAER